MPTAAHTTNLRIISTCALALGLVSCSRALDVTVNPYEIALPPGGTQVFSGWVSAESPFTSTALSWEADRGVVVGTGESVGYTAPDAEGPDAVTATSRSDPSRSATATVTVTTTGARVWARQFGAGEKVFDAAHAIAADAAANVLVVGSTLGNLAANGAGGKDAFVRKYDSDGREVWTRQFGTGEDDVALGVAVDPTGNVLVVGETRGGLTGAHLGEGDAFVRKYDAHGTELWTRQFGSGGQDRAAGVAADAAGNVVVVGRTGGGLTDGAAAASDGGSFVRKYDAQGQELWTRQVVGANAWAVAVDAAGNLVVAGSTMGSLVGTNLGGADAFVRTYDGAGTEGWVRQFGSQSHDSATGVAVDPSGRVLVVGTTRWGGRGQPWIDTSGFVRCFDAAGNDLWARSVDLHQAFDGLAIAADGFGDVLVARTIGSNGPSTTILEKLAANGEERWSRRVGTTTNDGVAALAVDATANVFVAGTTAYRVDALFGSFRTDAFVWRFSP
jgi:hypothetical protein